eukprot:COSAG02_NODE_20621_length_822_cov_2.098202_2_plen_241_part_01
MADAEEFAAAARRGEQTAAEIMRNALSAAQSAVDDQGAGAVAEWRGDADVAGVADVADVAGRIERAGQLAGGHAYFDAMHTLESLEFPLSPRRLTALGQPSGRGNDRTAGRGQPASPLHAHPLQAKGRTQAETVREWRDMATSPMPRTAEDKTTADISTTPGRLVQARGASEQLEHLLESVQLQTDVPMQQYFLDQQRHVAGPDGQFVPQLPALAQPAATYQSPDASDSGCSSSEEEEDDR